MPKQTAIKRKRGFERDVIAKKSFRHYKGGTVAAAPAAQYHIPKPRSESEDLLKVLDNLTSFAKSGGKLFTEYQEKKGAEAAARGEERPTPGLFNSAMVASYDLFQGKADVAKIQGTLLEQHNKFVSQLQQSKDLNAVDYVKMLAAYDKDSDKLLNDVLKNRPQDYILGMQEDVAFYKNGLRSKYGAAQVNHLKGLGLENIVRISDYEGVNLKNKIASTTTDPVEYQNKVAAGQRTMLTELQGLGWGLYQIDKKTISKQFLASQGQKAILDGNPESLLFTEIPDIDGFRIIDDPELRQDTFNYLKQAIAAQNTLTGRKERLRKQIEDDAITDIERTLSTVIGTGVRDKKAISAFKATLVKYADSTANPEGITLSPEKLDHYWTAINSLEADEVFERLESNSMVHMDLKIKASSGVDVLSELIRKQSSLSREDFESILNKYLQVQGERRNKSSKTQTPLEKATTETASRLRASFVEIKDIAGLEERLDPAKTYIRQQKGMLAFYEMLDQLKRSATKEKPFNFNSLSELYDAARYSAYMDIPIEINKRGVGMYDPHLAEPPKWYGGKKSKQDTTPKTTTPKFDKLFDDIDTTQGE